MSLDRHGIGCEGRPYRCLSLTSGGLQLAVRRVQPRSGSDLRDARAILAPSFVGVCRSDLRELAGTRPIRSDFGHEIVARVVELEPAVLFPLTQAPAVCLDPHVPVSRTSGFGELVELTAPAADLAQALRPLPESLAAALGVFVEPMACAWHCAGRTLSARALRGAPHPRGAVVGAGTAGTLIALALQASGLEIDLFNRSSGRLDFLSERGVFDAAALRELNHTLGQRYEAIVIATSELTGETLQWALEAVCDGGAVVLYAATAPGALVAGIDVDPIRREERCMAVPHAGRTVFLLGSHGAVAGDFDRSTAMLAGDERNSVRRRLSGLLGPELALEEALVELPRHVRAGFVGKAYVRLADPSAS